jgi:pyruvate/2-oxoglutarate/acetoin dehydrogenase E1 component
MAADPSEIVLGEDVERGGPGGGFHGLAEKHPRRVVDTAVSDRKLATWLEQVTDEEYAKAPATRP